MKFSCIIFICLASHTVYSFTVDIADEKLYSNGYNETVLNLPAPNNISEEGLPEVHIVGGVPATRNEFPWLVHLNADGSFCGGTLIAMDMVLTAAHCLVTDDGGIVKAGKITVVAGDHSRSANDGTEQRVTASGVKLHENYSRRSFANDIALIRLSRNLTRNSQVRPIPLSTSGPVYSSRGTVAGWGSTSEGGLITDTLRKVTVNIIRGTTCAKQMTNPTDQFCAGESGKDSCQGDSGGPFICQNSPNEICGIVSYGEGCARAGSPGVYSNVMEYVQWINTNLDFNSATDIFASKILIIVSFYFSISMFYE